MGWVLTLICMEFRAAFAAFGTFAPRSDEIVIGCEHVDDWIAQLAYRWRFGLVHIALAVEMGDSLCLSERVQETEYRRFRFAVFLRFVKTRSAE